jgi:hypothetical protein
MAKDKNAAVDTETEPQEQEQPEKLTPSQILDKVVNGEITPEEAKKLNEERKKRPIEFHRGAKGTFGIKGIRRFPVVNLYGNEVEKVAEVWPKFLDWVASEQAREAAEAEAATEEGGEEAA